MKKWWYYLTFENQVKTIQIEDPKLIFGAREVGGPFDFELDAHVAGVQSLLEYIAKDDRRRRR